MKKGIIILDKPAGITSFTACDEARKKAGAKKAGHAGTLDPNVTGVLLITLNNATKLMPLFEKLNKEYEGKAHLHKNISLKKLEKTVKEKFLGKIKQIPPRKSRVKRQEREREIYEIKILKKQDKDFDFRLKCEAGTYIRKLIHDLGQELGCGAHMVRLRRIKQGPFSEKQAIKLEKLNEKNIIKVEKVIPKVSTIIFIKKEAEQKLKQGKFLEAKDIGEIKGDFEKEKIIAVFRDMEVVALARPFFSSRQIKNKKGYVLKPERII